MALMIADGGGARPVAPYRPDPDVSTLVRPDPPPPLAPQHYRNSEPCYHPQVAPAGGGGAAPSAAGGTYGIPDGSSLGTVASGTTAQPFDVTLSQLATAVYGTRGDPPAGWSTVPDADLAARLGGDGPPASATEVQAWRDTFLGGDTQTMAQEFRAEVYTDGDGSYVLAYRGTAEGLPDWMNNFRQGTGFETDAVDKFSGTALNTAAEFRDLFGDGSAGGGNLAITGHSQGGGLASVASLATGIPAVTFDASGIHPNTLARMRLSPEQARDVAEGGQVRAYSLHSDLLTQTQESGLVGLVAPDALGTSVVVEPGPVARHTLAGRAAGVEWDLPLAGEAGVNTLVEQLRHSPFPISNGVGDLAYAALSHNPNVLTEAMVEQQPWQPGYANPTDIGKSLHDLLPDAAKDDYARNTHDLISDIGGVIDSQFRDGEFVEGGFRIAGDLLEGAWNSTGDTVRAYADEASQAIDDRVDGVVGDVLAGTVAFGGRAVEGVADVAGSGAELVADAGGFVAQKAVDVGSWLFGR